MREIKFRAWDADNDNMVNLVGLTPEGIVYSIPGHGESFDNFNYYTNCALMQYTGLKDKNGVEIFEEDIVQRELSRSWEIKHFGQVITGVVKYLDDSYWIDFDVDATSLFCEIDPVEVIGNNYENPELLEVAE